MKATATAPEVVASRPSRQEKYNGMNWISQYKRLAIYLRDGLACVWCGATVEQEGTQLSLDHVQAYSHGGSDEPSNLVTCCMKCNRSRSNRSKETFAAVVARRLGNVVTRERILANIYNARRRQVELHYQTAKDLVKRRGSCFAALQSDELQGRS